MAGPAGPVGADDLAVLESIQRRVLWLSTWMVHHANNLRPNPDGLKVGGHQASSASVVTLLTALYFRALGPDDAVALKAHGSPAFYAIQYLRGRLEADALRSLRQLGGLQAYPSHRKNPELVDLSTGSMGLGAVQATFGALAARYLRDHGGTGGPRRFVVMVGDAELDEGNVWEAVLEEITGRLEDVLWIVDLNRQSLDRLAPEGRRRQLAAMFGSGGWHVIELRHGLRRRALFDARGGATLRARLESMATGELHALLRGAPAAARKALITAPSGAVDAAMEALLGDLDDAGVHALIGDVGGHDLAAVLEALAEAEAHRGAPCVIIADTVKGWGLPLAGDPLNHGALLGTGQMAELRAALGVTEGREWDRFPAGSAEARLIAGLPPLLATRPHTAPRAPLGLEATEFPERCSTQEAFGRVLQGLARVPAADRVVTISADVAVTTHLAGWINRRGVYFPETRTHALAETSAALRWRESPQGQHVELGIAEHNLFLLLGALGLTGELAGEPLAAIGTLYDPFVSRGLDALYHALYSGSRFIVVATPSGVSLSPEGGAHQSVITPPIGVALPAMAYYEPVFAREVEWLLLEWVERLLAGDPDVESLYLRLTTAVVDQALAPRHADHRADALAGGYRLVDGSRAPDWDPETNAVHLFAAGILVPEAVEAGRRLEARGVRASVFAVTSPDRLYRGLRAGASARARWLERLVRPEEEGVPVVSAIDGHSQALAFIGSALGVPQVPLGVDDFGQSGTRPDLYAHYAIDAAAMERAALLLLGERAS